MEIWTYTYMHIPMPLPGENVSCRIVLAMGLYYYGLRATSAAYSVNFLNLIPIVTFVIAIMLRYSI